MSKMFVKVDCRKSRAGTEKPSVIYWPDGRNWKIKRVLHETVLEGTDFEGIRYTILIGSAEKYIYRNSEGWFVVPPS